MHVLVVTADPGNRSFAASLAERYLAGMQSHATPAVERADLFGEAFDPRMAEADLALYRSEGSAHLRNLATALLHNSLNRIRFKDKIMQQV
ncbi:NAD(P)H-dependent oxidoreductase [Ensifer sp. LC163]|uniref:NAD(P)H-dependent oxidoreductase n=1 Tax=Ensifer sp. LC163 TaxID=1120652 RepID=UPI00081384B5|nr:NAD(P)H-dependent oxidoreductase [Ensifer sp. LC163]OCP35468.1 hypothetical protein BC360_09310 [Ensifer sp. LC163]